MSDPERQTPSKGRVKMQSRYRTIAVLTLVALALSGCGIRGALEQPSDSQTTTDTNASADSGQGKPENAAPKPHKDFVLDRLIR